MTKYFVHKKFSETADLFPKNTAITEVDRELNYQQLDRCANQLSHCIKSHQIAAEEQPPVALFLPKSIEYIMASLAILKSDQAFLPLSPDLPEARLSDILLKAQPQLIITNKAMADTLVKTLETLDLKKIAIKVFDYKTNKYANTDGFIEFYDIESGKQHDADYPNTVPDMQATPDHNNYIMFTSGTTGAPKAIVGRHKSLSHFIHWETTEFALSSNIRVAQLAPTTFDVSLRDIFVPLLSGGVCCIPSAEVQHDARRLLHWIIDSKITLIHCVPSIFRLLMTELEAEGNNVEENAKQLSNLKYVMLAGEPLLGRDVNRWIELVGDGAELVNLYGPSETTLAKLFKRIKGPVDHPNKVMPIGNPISNTAVLILTNNVLCQVGEIGEIYIKTPFRSKGYLNDKPLTDLSFIQNPLNSDNLDIIYKTGDLGRYMADRSVEVLGRMDRQVKLNGVRVELNDIEGHILDLADIDHCFLSVHKNENQHSLLVCYYTCHHDISVAEIKSLLSNKLQANLIPTLMIKLTQFPLMLNGKVDRKALPNPATYLSEMNNDDEQDLNPTESTLSKIWSDSLGATNIGIQHRFFDLGGTSLTVMKVLGEIYRQLEVEISILDFYQYDTIAALAEYIDENPTFKSNDYQAITPAPKQDLYALGSHQQSLWMSEVMADEQASFNIPGAWWLNGKLNVAAFERAIDTVISRHDSLRIAIVMEKNQPYQRIQTSLNSSLEVIDLSSAEDGQAQADAIMAEDSLQHFQLEQAPLFRLKLFTLGKQKQLFYFCFHHLISDAWSLGLFGTELMQTYEAFCKKETYEPAPLSIQYQDFCHWRTLAPQQEKLDTQKSYWLNRFAESAPVLNLPTDFIRPAEKGFCGAQEQFTLEKSVSQQLNAMSREQNTTLFSCLMTIYQLLLSKYTAQQDIVIGFPTAGREHPDLAPLLGMFVNTLPLRNHCSADLTFTELLNNTSKNINDALMNQSYPLQELVKALEIPRDMSRNPLFDTLMILQNFVDADLQNSDLELSPANIPQTTAWYDLTLNWMEHDGQLHCKVIYDTNLFRPETITRLGQHFNTIVKQILVQPNKAISTISLLSDAEYQQINVDFNPAINSSADPIPTDNIVQRFEYWAQIAPAVTAVSFWHNRISYENLNRETNQLARHLLKQGVKPGDVIGTYMPRSELMIKSILAILKLGAVYMPIDTDYPLTRKKYMISDSGVTLMLISAQSPDSEFDNIQNVRADDPVLTAYDDSNISTTPLSDATAYIIYTSGSTGDPKGTLGHHQGVVNLAAHFKKYLNIGADDRFLQFASCSFDASIFEIFITLLSGSTLILVAEETIEEIGDFEHYINEQQVTVTVLPPTYVRQLDPNNLPNLKTLMTAGSATDHTLIEKWLEKVRYINAYGPTETTVCASAFDVSSQDLQQLKDSYRSIPIGKPIANFRLDIMDEHQQLLPIGIPGELCISGVGVAQGYLNKQKLTTQSFMNNPHAPELAMYKTGDVARWLPDGNIEFLGRKDDQVKIRGYRIELAEVEHNLQSLDAVTDAMILVNGPKSSQQLAAYYIGTLGSEPEIRAKLAQILPHYMVPATFIAMESFPLTPNGKIDKVALRNQSSSNQSIAALVSKDQQSFDTIQSALRNVWQKLLGIDSIGLSDSFIELGGDSINAIQTVAELKNMGLNLSSRYILQFPTIEKLSQYITYSDQVNNEQVQGEVLLTPIQQWFFNEYQGDKQKFFQSSLLKYANGINIQAMKKALQTVTDHHDALRSSYRQNTESQQWQQHIIATGMTIDMHTVALANADKALMEPHINALAEQVWLDKQPLIQTILFKTPDMGDHLFILAHHLIVDTVSWWILLEDLELAYSKILADETFSLGSKTTSMQTWSQQLHSYSSSKKLLNEVELWENVNTRLKSSFKFPPANGEMKPQKVTCELPIKETRALISTNAQLGFGMNHLLLTLHGRAMTKIFGPQSFAIAIENHGREDCFDDIDVSRTIGWFTSMYPMVLDQTASATLKDDIDKTHATMQAIPDKGIGYGILHNADTINNGSRPEASFNYYGMVEADSNQSTLVDCNFLALEQPLQHAMEFSAAIKNGKLHIELAFNSSKISLASADQWLSHLNSELKTYLSQYHKNDQAHLKNVAKKLSHRFNNSLDGIIEKFNVPGIVLGARLADGSHILGCSGLNNAQTTTLLSTDHHFRIGSLTKTFISTLVLQLVDEDLLMLDQSISEQLDQTFLTTSGLDQSITIRQLLNHTSGLQDYVKNDKFREQCQHEPDKIWLPEELIAFSNASTSPFSPGEADHWLYSSSGYILLGLIIEKVCQSTLEKALQSRIFTPLELKNTALDMGNLPLGQLATGHNAQAIPLTDQITSHAWAAGGITSTVEDLLVWQDSYVNGKLLSPQMQQQRLDFINLPEHITLEQDIQAGLGIFNLEDRLGHLGDTPGYEAGMLCQGDVQLVMLLNGETPLPTMVFAGSVFEALTELV